MTFQNNFLRLRRTLARSAMTKSMTGQNGATTFGHRENAENGNSSGIALRGAIISFKQGTLTEGEGSVQLTSKLS